MDFCFNAETSDKSRRACEEDCGCSFQRRDKVNTRVLESMAADFHLNAEISKLQPCLQYTIPHYTILYFTILYYTTPHYTILYYTILYYTILYYTIRGHGAAGARGEPPRAPGQVDG